MLDSVSEELRRVYAGYTLPNKAGVLQEVRIFTQYMPQPSGITFTERELKGMANYGEEDYEKNFPSVIVKLGDIEDNEERRLDLNRTGLRLLFGVYDDSEECTGWRDVAGMMEKLRQHLLKSRIIARKYRIEMPLKWRLLDVDTYPLYFGEMEIKMECGRPVRPVDYVYRGYCENG